MTNTEYNDWFIRGYAAFTTGEECPADATPAQESAWRDGVNTATEEDENGDE